MAVISIQQIIGVDEVVLSSKESPLVERLHVIEDDAHNVIGVIALDSTVLGPAAGGCRFWSYSSVAEMTTDAIRLARGMSYKNALAGLPFGGGKAVLQRPGAVFDRRAIFSTFANAVAELDGAYVTAEDVGTTVADMEWVARSTRHVAGRQAQPGKAGGDPSPWTALGIFMSMQAASRIVLGSDVRGMTVAVQGVGNVGSRLCGLLAEAGARLVVADVDPDLASTVARKYAARLVSVDEILLAQAEILAPCALGAVLNSQTIPTLRVGMICGGANNQLAAAADGNALWAQNIAYAPDYVVNAGGIINVAAEYLGESLSDVQRRIDAIAERVAQIMRQAIVERRPEYLIADDMARSIIHAGRLVAA
jgi:leucine dehydrogenase